VRVSHDEALRMRADTSAYMLRLSLAVHAAHSFTNAAATDGSLLAHGGAVTRVVASLRSAICLLAAGTLPQGRLGGGARAYARGCVMRAYPSWHASAAG
jgi:hypothetical protein